MDREGAGAAVVRGGRLVGGFPMSLGLVAFTFTFAIALLTLSPCHLILLEGAMPLLLGQVAVAVKAAAVLAIHRAGVVES